jgi:hypothetical protein
MKALPQFGEKRNMLLALKSKPDKNDNRDLLSGPYPLPEPPTRQLDGGKAIFRVL